jgi:hypothetical protein
VELLSRTDKQAVASPKEKEELAPAQLTGPSTTASGASAPALPVSSSPAVPLLHQIPVNSSPVSSSVASSASGGITQPAKRQPIPAETVAKLMQHAATAAYKTFAYHATKTGAVEGPTGIAATGLQPRYGGTGASGTSEEMIEQSRGKVHYARRYEHVDAYREFSEGSKTAFPGKVHPSPGPSEVLQLSLHASDLQHEQRDRDDNSARVTPQAIAPESIKRLKPSPIPASRAEGELMWREHNLRGLTSLEALKSNMPAEGQQMVDELVGSGLHESALLQMVKQGLMAHNTEKFLPFDQIRHNPRVAQSHLSGTGTPLPAKK